MARGDLVYAMQVLRDAGYVVIRKDNVHKLTAQCAMSMFDEEVVNNDEQFQKYIIAKLAQELAKAITEHPQIVFYQINDVAEGRVIKHVTLNVVLPNG